MSSSTSLREMATASTTPTKRKTKRILRCAMVWGVCVVLKSIDVSTATQHQQHQRPQNRRQPHGIGNKPFESEAKHLGWIGSGLRWSLVDGLRGGSTILQPPPPPPPLGDEPRPERSSISSPPQQQPPTPLQQLQPTQTDIREPDNNNIKKETSFLPKIPKIDLRQAARVLLHTSEWNRRLQEGVRHWGNHRNNQYKLLPSSSPLSLSPRGGINGNHQHGNNQHYAYGNLPVNVHPSRTWQPPIRASSGRDFGEEELTLFHAKMPRVEAPGNKNDNDNETGDDNTGPRDEVRSWGPDLLPYLEHISNVLGMDHDGIEIVLAMIYLDRACSVETPRSNGVPSCPFCSPRTVHRLGLAALVVASHAVRGSAQPGEDPVAKLALSLGIPLPQLRHMVEWMVAALGDDGTYVDLEEMGARSAGWKPFLLRSGEKSQ